MNNSVKRFLILIISGTQHQKKLDVNDFSSAPSPLKTVATLPCEMQKLYFGRLQQWMHTGSACVSSEYYLDHKIIENLLSPGWLHRVDCVLQVSLSCKISNVNELKRRINREWAAVRHAIIECAVGEWRNVLDALAFVLEADILSTCCNKDDAMWHVWLFWDSNCQSCLSLFS